MAYFKIRNRVTGGTINTIRYVDGENKVYSSEERTKRRRKEAERILNRWNDSGALTKAQLYIEELPGD